MAKVAVAVVSTNLRDLLAAALRSLEADVEAGRAEVWVVDNASTDGSPEMVAREFPWAKLVASDENLGYGRAVNLVAERTDTPWIAPANEDIELEPGALAELLAVAEAEPRAAVVAPRLVLADGSTQHSVYPFPTLGFTLWFNLGLYRLSRRRADERCLEVFWDPDRRRDVPWAIATFMLIRRDAWDEAGGFDVRQFIHSEDLDLGWRLAERGWRAVYVPHARVRHVGSAASKKAFGPKLMARWMAATYGVIARRRGVAYAWAVALVNVLGAGARYLAVPRRRGYYREWLAIHRQGLRSRAALLGQD